MDFAIGDYVVHRHEGVCKISKIVNADFGDGKRKYYVLTPVYTNTELIVRIPVDNTILIRHHISKRNAQMMVKKLRKGKAVWINDNRKRKEFFQKMIVAGDMESLAKVAHTVYVKKAEFSKAKKSMPLTDQNLANFCERLLMEELAISLGIDIDKVDAYIEKHSK